MMEFTLFTLEILNIVKFLLIFIGFYVTIWWCCASLTSPVQLIVKSLLPYLKCQKPKTLSEKYGKWAGKLCKNILSL